MLRLIFVLTVGTLRFASGRGLGELLSAQTPQTVWGTSQSFRDPFESQLPVTWIPDDSNDSCSPLGAEVHELCAWSKAHGTCLQPMNATCIQAFNKWVSCKKLDATTAKKYKLQCSNRHVPSTTGVPCSALEHMAVETCGWSHEFRTCMKPPSTSCMSALDEWSTCKNLPNVTADGIKNECAKGCDGLGKETAALCGWSDYHQTCLKPIDSACRQSFTRWVACQKFDHATITKHKERCQKGAGNVTCDALGDHARELCSFSLEEQKCSKPMDSACEGAFHEWAACKKFHPHVTAALKSQCSTALSFNSSAHPCTTLGVHADNACGWHGENGNCKPANMSCKVAFSAAVSCAEATGVPQVQIELFTSNFATNCTADDNTEAWVGKLVIPLIGAPQLASAPLWLLATAVLFVLILAMAAVKHFTGTATAPPKPAYTLIRDQALVV